MIKASNKNKSKLTAGFIIRWLLLLTFPAGFLFTVAAYPAEWDYYFLLNAISFLSACLLLSRLKRVTADNIIIWIFFMVLLVGYYVKFYFFIRGFIMGRNIAESVVLMGGYAALLATPALLLDCFTSISLSFCFFAIAAFYMLRDKRGLVAPAGSDSRKKYWNKLCYTMIFISACLAVITGLTRWLFKLGLPGEVSKLPYKLAGITNVTSTHVVSILLGLALIYAIRSNNKQTLRITIISFFAWGVSNFFLFTSKLFLALPMFWIIIIGIWENRPLLRWKYLIGYGGLFVLLYPFLNLVRVVRYSDTEDSIFLTVAEAVISSGSSGQVTDSLSFLSLGLYGLMSRIVGLDSMMILTAIKPGFPDFDISNILGGGAEKILTNYILGWGNRGTGIAQSLIGQAYFHSGSSVMTAVLVTAWAVIAYKVAKWLYKINSSFSQVLWVTWIASVLQWTSDGFTANKLLVFLVSAIPIYLIIFIVEFKK